MLRGITLLFLSTCTFNLFAACSVDISSSDNLKFNKSKITVDSSCDKFTVNFAHEGQMAAKTAGHNVVIVKSSDFDTVVSKINMKLGVASGFLPEMNEVVAKTAIIGGGSKTSVVINATKLSKADVYTFFCSFPGHYGAMKGIVEVI